MYKFEEIKDQVLNYVCSLPPHSKIMSRNALCIKYGVTRTTVDRALLGLQEEGYLYSRKGSGTYVVDRLENKDIVSCWGIMLPNVVKEVYPGMLSGIEAFASSHSRNIIFGSSDNDADKEYSNIVRLLKSDVKGFIIIPYISNSTDYRVYNLLQQEGIPFVFCNRHIDGIRMPFVGNNGYYGGFIATKRLLATGARRIAYISEKRYALSIQRYGGYCAGLETSGLALDENLVLLSYDDPGQIEELIDRYEPEAIFAFNDSIASVVYSILVEKKLRVGKDISLIGYDDSSVCTMLPVKLTSVSYRSFDIGYYAAGILYDMQVNGHYPKVDVKLFQPEIVERDSCLPPMEAYRDHTSSEGESKL